MKPLGVRARLTLIYATLFALVLMALGLLAYRTLASRLLNSVDEQLEEMATGLRGYLRFDQGKPELVADPNDSEQVFFVQTAGRYVEVYDASSGELLYQSRDLDILNLDLTPAEVQQAIQELGTGDIESERIHLRVHDSLVHPANGHVYLLRVGISMLPAHNALNQFRRTLLLLIPLGIFAAGLAGWWAARLALRPVRQLSRTAHAISPSELKRRLPLRGTNDELDQLADAFNGVLSRLEQSARQMRDFTANISHELRTPLAALRGEAEVTLAAPRPAEEYRRVLESQLEEFDKLSRLVNDLLTLARAESGAIVLRSEPVDLAGLAQAATGWLRPVAEDRGLVMELEAEGEIVVNGDAHWLEHMLLNLLDNAVKFTQAGGVIRVRTYTEHGQAVLEVSDSGIGIPPEALEHIFDRFYQVEESRSNQAGGTGLGLALVHWIVEAHLGHIDARSQPGAGTTFKIKLPLTKSTSAVSLAAFPGISEI
jgi:heavy metal sensor kinase